MKRLLGMALLAAVAGASLMSCGGRVDDDVTFVGYGLALSEATTTTEAPPAPVEVPPAPVAEPAPAAARAARTRAPLPPATRPLTPPFSVAHVAGPTLPVFPSPGAAAPSREFRDRNEIGQHQVLLVKSKVDSQWVETYLPTRPNGVTGYVRTADVTFSQTDLQVLVERAAHRITVWQGDTIVFQETVAVGKSRTPTPGGVFFIDGLARTPSPGGAYGPYIFTLSAFSEVHQTFAGGPGTVGLHGTNQPRLLGQSVSNGCVRMSNAAISRLAEFLTLGTPVVIV